MYSLKFAKLDERATLPTRATPGSAGLDIFSIVSVEVRPGKRMAIQTGLKVFLPYGTYGRIAPRSGLALFSGIDVMAGVIDSDYTGEIVVLLINLSDKVFNVFEGMKICQLIIEKFKPMNPILVEVDGSTSTERGDKGFGSSGI